MRALLVGAMLALPWGQVARAAPVELGPYLQDVRPDGALVAWETAEAVPGEVAVETPAGVRRFTSPAGRRHEVRVAGLAPGCYRYRARAGGAEGAAAELCTAPAGGRFTFLVYGDNRDGDAAHAQLVAAMQAQRPDLLLNTGDLTGDGSAEHLWRRFFTIEAPLLAGVPLYPALGNHEVLHDQSAAHFHRFFALPGPLPQEHAERRYAFRYANAQFIALDSNHSHDHVQAAWLVQTLDTAHADPTIQHIFVFFHHPPFSTATECGSAAEQGLWVPQFERDKVRAVFAGHEHAYQHLERAGVRYFVTGGGGAPLHRQSAHCPEYDRSALRLFHSEHHFLRVRVRGEQASLDAISADGATIESVALHERAPREAVPPPPIPFRHVTPGTPAPEPRPDVEPGAGPKRHWYWILLLGAPVGGGAIVLVRRRRLPLA